MTEFLAFALYLCFSALLLIVAPVMMHPTLPMRRKALLLAITFFILIPGALALYGVLGAPGMAEAQNLR